MIFTGMGGTSGFTGGVLATGLPAQEKRTAAIVNNMIKTGALLMFAIFIESL
jgi:hypothetical protein